MKRGHGSGRGSTKQDWQHRHSLRISFPPSYSRECVPICLTALKMFSPRPQLAGSYLLISPDPNSTNGHLGPLTVWQWPPRDWRQGCHSSPGKWEWPPFTLGSCPHSVLPSWLVCNPITNSMWAISESHNLFHFPIEGDVRSLAPFHYPFE